MGKKRPSAVTISIVNYSTTLALFERIRNNDLCSKCAALSISIMVTPHGQPHAESIQCLDRSAQSCPLCYSLASTIGATTTSRRAADQNDRPDQGGLVCRVTLKDGISSMYLAYSRCPLKSLCDSPMVEHRVFTAEGIVLPSMTTI